MKLLKLFLLSSLVLQTQSNINHLGKCFFAGSIITLTYFVKYKICSIKDTTHNKKFHKLKKHLNKQ